MHTITGKLNKSAHQFQAGEATGFGIRLGQKYRDRKTGQDEWTNYSAVIFAKSPSQINFYQKVLTTNAIVEVSGDTLRVDNYEGQNGNIVTLEIQNARLGFVSGGTESAPQLAPQGTPTIEDDLPF